MRVSTDRRIECGDSFNGIDHQQSNICSFEMLARHHHGELLRHQSGFAFAADTGSVDEAITLFVPLYDFIHSVARGAGNWRHDSSRRTGELIQQCRLADVGSADNCNFRLCRLLSPRLFHFCFGRDRHSRGRLCHTRFRQLGRGRHQLKCGVQKLAQAISMLC